MTSSIEPIKIKKGQKIVQLIVSNIMYPEIKKVKFLVKDFSKGFSDEVFEYFNMYNYKI